MDANNAAAMREALEAARSLLLPQCNGGTAFAKACAAACDKIASALAASPRNCDLPYTDEHELWLRWQNHCAEIFPKAVKFSIWLLAPATEQEGGAQ